MPLSPTTCRAPARALLALALALLCAAPAAALDEARAARERALRLSGEGRCAAALPELDAGRAAWPDDAQLALRAGQCRMRLHRYAEAQRDLEDAVRLEPDRGEAQLALAKASYHARDLTRAQTALDAADALLPDDAEVALYRGMLQLEAGDGAAAIESLERARALDAQRVEPVASHYLTQARQQAEGRRHAWLGVGAGIEHDTNVVLLGRGVPDPGDISDEKDQRGVWTANGGLELWKNERAALGAMASYHGTTHVDLHEFDAHFPSATTWLDFELAERWRANARYDLGYAWLDGDPFLITNSWQASLRRLFEQRGSSEVHVRTQLEDFFYDSDDVPDATAGLPPCGGASTCGPSGLDERSERRRSGWRLETGIEHELPVGPAALRGGYAFGLFDARGREYSHHEHGLRVGLSAQLPLELLADLSGGYVYRQFRHPSTFPDSPLPTNGSPYVLSGVRRREEMFLLQTELSRPIGEQVVVSARWRYIDNQSNTEVFDYEQQVFGLYVDLLFGREL